MNSGIYQIINTVNDHRYIGKATDVDKRWLRHKRDLSKGRNTIKLQRAWDKYGEEAFSFEMIERCEMPCLFEREQHYFDLLSPEYNILKTAGSALGYKHTEEAKRKIGRANAISLKGRIIPEETRHKMSISRMGEKNGFYGKRHSKETKIKIGLSGLGRPGPNLGKPSPLRGRKLSEERKQGLRKAWIKRKENKKI